MHTFSFKDFLREVIAPRPGYSIRESELYRVLKEFYGDYDLPIPSWKEFHRHIGDSNIQKMQHDHITALIGCGWNRNSAYCPDDARDYALPAGGNAPPVRQGYTSTSRRHRSSTPVTAVPVRTPPIPDDPDPAPWE